MTTTEPPATATGASEQSKSSGFSLKANFWNPDQGNPVLEYDILYAGIRGFPLSSEDLALIGQ